jgi:hypothetical protein
MLHKWESKSKVENRGRRKIQPLKLKGKAQQVGLPFFHLRFGELVSFLANERRHIEIVRTCVHHRPRRIV